MRTNKPTLLGLILAVIVIAAIVAIVYLIVYFATKPIPSSSAVIPLPSHVFVEKPQPKPWTYAVGNQWGEGVICIERENQSLLCCTNSIVTHITLNDFTKNYSNKTLVILSDNNVVIEGIALDAVDLNGLKLDRRMVLNPITRTLEDIMCDREYTLAVVSTDYFNNYDFKDLINHSLIYKQIVSRGSRMTYNLDDNNITLLYNDPQCRECDRQYADYLNSKNG